MKPIFADTSYFVALCGPNDAFHSRAVALSGDISARIVTSEYVLVETGGLLLRPEDRDVYINLVRGLQSDPTVHIVPASRKAFRAGFAMFTARPDKAWSMVDCISFSILKQLRLDAALTADQHFIQTGFRALLRE